LSGHLEYLNKVELIMFNTKSVWHHFF